MKYGTVLKVCLLLKFALNSVAYMNTCPEKKNIMDMKRLSVAEEALSAFFSLQFTSIKAVTLS